MKISGINIKTKHPGLRAFAMIYAVLVMIFITIILCAFIMLMYYNKLYLDVSIRKGKLTEDAVSGINLFLSDPTILGIDEKKSIQLYDDEDDKIMLSRKKWGIFDLIISTAEWQKHKFSKIALLGDNIPDSNKVALYLTDRGKPLGLCGKTVIKGKCFLPKSGVIRENIEGENFVGLKLIDGIVKQSEKILPVYSGIKDFFKVIENRKFSDDNDTVIPYEEFTGDTLINLFTDRTFVLYSDRDISLDYKFYKGNIKIISDKSVKVSGTSSLQDVIIIAPYISFRKEFSGSLQAYAGDSISMEEESELIYPSVIGLYNTKPDTIQPYILMKEKSKMNGIVFLYSEKSPAILRPYIKIEKGAIITGQLISTNDIQLQGKVIGSVYCNRFVLKTYSAYYENILLDVTIDNTDLSKEYVGISPEKKLKRKKIIKWLF